MLGSDFLKVLSGSVDFEMYAFNKEELDIDDKNKTMDIFRQISPDFVINAAAYTAVDACEDEKELAFKLNGEAPGYLAEVCKEQNAILLHISTDYVFDGEKMNGYIENDKPAPVNVYGESKLKGEELIMEKMDDYYIVRTSWLFGENGQNFVDTMLKLGKEKNEINVVDDQIGSPTYTKDLCEEIIRCFLMPYVSGLPTQHVRTMDQDSEPVMNKPAFGIYHLTNAEHISWYGYAKKIFEFMKMDVKVNPITSKEFPRPAKRPSCSILLNTKLDCKMRTWNEALSAYLALTT